MQTNGADKRVGWIGLGNLGGAMARRIQSAIMLTTNPELKTR